MHTRVPAAYATVSLSLCQAAHCVVVLLAAAINTIAACGSLARLLNKWGSPISHRRFMCCLARNRHSKEKAHRLGQRLATRRGSWSITADARRVPLLHKGQNARGRAGGRLGVAPGLGLGQPARRVAEVQLQGAQRDCLAGVPPARGCAEANEDTARHAPVARALLLGATYRVTASRQDSGSCSRP